MIYDKFDPAIIKMGGTYLPEEFAIKCPQYSPIPVGSVKNSGILKSIEKFIVHTNGIYQLSVYESQTHPKIRVNFEQIVSFLPPESLTDQFEKAQRNLKIMESLYQSILSSTGTVIDPETFEPFDKNSNEFQIYI